jgi:hypothetical protein
MPLSRPLGVCGSFDSKAEPTNGIRVFSGESVTQVLLGDVTNMTATSPMCNLRGLAWLRGQWFCGCLSTRTLELH